MEKIHVDFTKKSYVVMSDNILGDLNNNMLNIDIKTKYIILSLLNVFVH